MKFIGEISNVLSEDGGGLYVQVRVQDLSKGMELKSLKGKSIVFDTKELKKDRTLRQNNYAWKLIGLISEKLYQTDEDTYLTALKEANAKYEYIGAIPEAEENLKSLFRVVELVDERPKMNVYRCYYGTSKMNREEFAKFLEVIQRWCTELDIDYEIERY